MENISHQGTVTSVNPPKVYVQITSYSACHNCDARHGCGLMECRNKSVEIDTPEAQLYRPGDKVIVSLAPRFGFLAVFYGYILPLLGMLITLLTVVFAGFSELIAGLSSIIVLIPYYFWLFLNRARFRQQFNFKISKQ